LKISSKESGKTDTEVLIHEVGPPNGCRDPLLLVQTEKKQTPKSRGGEAELEAGKIPVLFESLSSLRLVTSGDQRFSHHGNQ
jgi:hypothetical protein